VAENTLEMVTDWLAAGLDPAKSVIFIQSMVPEHAELHLLLSMITPLGWLERVPTYKEQIQQIENKDLHTYGFLGYPVLQTVDIIIYRAHFVPVGEDQSSHLEMSREVVRRFQHLYGPVFPEPQTLFTPTPKVPGIDGRKMSKSYGNTIGLREDPDEVTKKLKQMQTDPARVRRTDPGNPDVCPVFDLHKIYSSEETRTWAANGCRTAGIGCLECKKPLIDKVVEEISGIRKRAAEFEENPELVRNIVAEGGEKARDAARATLDDVRRAMNLRVD
jgi:tryptophanyl-tRNA synthetase